MTKLSELGDRVIWVAQGRDVFQRHCVIGVRNRLLIRGIISTRMYFRPRVSSE